MDIYLPADFHEVRNCVATDWRDGHSTFNDSPVPALDERTNQMSPDASNACADPNWCVF